jgi:hypothetical protein
LQVIPLEALRNIELQWRSVSIAELSGEIRFLPFAVTVPDLAIGITEDGQWALARFVDDPARPGRIFDPSASSGLIFLCPLLDWTPRHVMSQVSVIACSASVPFSVLWNEFPWRYAIRSGLEVVRRSYHVDAALDWIRYLGVAEEFKTELRSLGVDADDLVLPRPRLEDFAIE